MVSRLMGVRGGNGVKMREQEPRFRVGGKRGRPGCSLKPSYPKCHFPNRNPEARAVLWGPWRSLGTLWEVEQWLRREVLAGTALCRGQLRGAGTAQGDLQIWCVWLLTFQNI